jgi:hypothetical protein
MVATAYCTRVQVRQHSESSVTHPHADLASELSLHRLRSWLQSPDSRISCTVSHKTLFPVIPYYWKHNGLILICFN